MLNENTPHDRLISAAFKLAEIRGWRSLSLIEIATEADIPLIEAHREFQSKAQILAAFSRAVDKAILEKFPKLSGAEAGRDRLFDVIMTRFEILQPYKAALRNIVKAVGMEMGAMLSQVRPALKSQYWMLAAAGFSGEGSVGLLRIKGLLAIYTKVFSIWLQDQDPGLARTMAALDKELRRGENAMRRLEGFRHGVERILCAIKGNPSEEKPIAPDTPPSADAPTSA